MNIALVLSGGTGTRLGADVPKQYIEVKGQPILLYCLQTLAQCEEIDGIQIVAASEWQETILTWLEQYGESAKAENKMLQKFRGFSLPGATRQLSVFNGLTDIGKYASEEALVLIHDGARPLLSRQLVEDCFAAIDGYEGVLPVLPMKDTVYQSEDGKQITALLNRSQVFAGQAPELFRLGEYYRANESLFPKKILQINGSTEPAICGNLRVAMIPGEEANFKITTRADLERFEALMSEKGHGAR